MSCRTYATESAAVPASDPLPPLDSGRDQNGVNAGTKSHLSDETTTENQPRSRGNQPRSFAAVAGMGFELAGTTVLLAGAGHLVDRYFGGERGIGFAVGGLIGFGLGMFRFILKALRQIEESNE